jgi:hypothetical protein
MKYDKDMKPLVIYIFFLVTPLFTLVASGLRDKNGALDDLESYELFQKTIQSQEIILQDVSRKEHFYRAWIKDVHRHLYFTEGFLRREDDSENKLVQQQRWSWTRLYKLPLKEKLRSFPRVIKTSLDESLVLFIDSRFRLQGYALKRSSKIKSSHFTFQKIFDEDSPPAATTPDGLWSLDRQFLFILLRGLDSQVHLGTFSVKTKSFMWNTYGGTVSGSPFFLRLKEKLLIIAQDYQGGFWKVDMTDFFQDPNKKRESKTNHWIFLHQLSLDGIFPLTSNQSFHHHRPLILKCEGMKGKSFWIYQNGQHQLYGSWFNEETGEGERWKFLGLSSWNHPNATCLSNGEILLWGKNSWGRWNKTMIRILR